MKIVLIDLAVGIPAFAFAAYSGANFLVALSFGFIVASVANVIGACINLARMGRR